MDIITLPDFGLTSSTIAENLYNGVAVPKWVAGTYASGDRVYYTGSVPHTVYDSLADANTAVPGTDAIKWLEREVTDRYAMFDDYTNTQSADTTAITVEVEAGRTNAVGLFSLQARTVELELSVSGVVKKTENFNMLTIAAPTFWDYAFSDLVQKYDLLWEYPQYPIGTATLKAKITYITGEQAKCGMMKLGRKATFGILQYGARTGIIDYSTETKDAFDRISLKKGDYAKRPEIDIWIPNTQIDSVYLALVKNRGINAIYNCNNPGMGYGCFLVHGKFDSFDIDIPGPKRSRCSIKFKGSTRGDI